MNRTIFLSKYFELQSSFTKIIHFRIREYIISQFFELLSLTYCKTIARNRIPWNTHREKLLEMPYSTLGYHLGKFLEKHDFQLLQKTENHDIFHLITGYPPKVKEEIGQQYLLFGNGKKSGLMYVALLSGLLLPEYFSFFIASYHQGKNMRKFYDWKFEHLLNEDFDSLLYFIYSHHKPTKSN